MSDYLWDKTGEPEEDVAQLENLLGALKYQPRPLEIPATAMPTPTTATAARTRPAIFSRPRLALAASLLLTLLAGAWLLTRQGETRQNQLAGVRQGSPSTVSEKPDNSVVPNVETHVETNKHASGGNSDQQKSREHKAVVATASAPRPQRTSRASLAKRQKFIPRVEENRAAPLEVAVVQGTMRWQVGQPLTPQQREATEQLMLALRMTSAKLNYAQREMLEIGRAGK